MVEHAVLNPEIEQRINYAKDAIVNRLNRREGYYFPITYVARNKDQDTALLLQGNGQWSYKFDMTGIILGDISNFEAVAWFAEIKDPQAIKLSIERGALTAPDRRTAKADEMLKYLEVNYERLAAEFAEALETTFREIQPARR